MKSWENCSDEELMSSYARGEYPAFQELYYRHSGRVLGFLCKRLNSKVDAEDVMQTVFLKLHQSRHRYDLKLPFLTWLFAITRNALIDHIRKLKKTTVELDASMVAEEAPSGTEFSNVLKHLPEGQRKVLELRFSEGLSFEEISNRAGISEISARKRVSRALKKIKELFG